MEEETSEEGKRKLSSTWKWLLTPRVSQSLNSYDSLNPTHSILCTSQLSSPTLTFLLPLIQLYQNGVQSLATICLITRFDTHLSHPLLATHYLREHYYSQHSIPPPTSRLMWLPTNVARGRLKRLFSSHSGPVSYYMFQLCIGWRMFPLMP